MILRRTFLGAMGAAGLSASAMAPLALAQPLFRPEAADLKWRCDVLDTLPHPSTGRAPVVTGICLQPQGQQLAIVGDDHHIGIYDVAERTYRQHFRAHDDWIRAARYSPRGNWLATAGNDRHLKIWDTRDWQGPRLLKIQESAIIALAFAHQGAALASVGFSNLLRIYQPETGQVISEHECPCDDNHAVCFSRDDRWIAVGGRSGDIKIWEVSTGKVILEKREHRQRIRSLIFTEDQRLISAGDDQQVRILDPLRPEASVALPRQSAKLFAATLLTGQRLATAGSDNRIHIWNLADQQLIGWLEGHTGTVSCLDADREILVSGSFDTQVRIWRPTPAAAADVRQTQLDTQWQGRLK